MDWLKRTFSKLARYFGIAFYAMVLIFLGIYISNLDFESLARLSVDWVWLLVATVFGLGARYLFARIWIFFLHNLGATIKGEKTLELYEVYAKSWLGRYIPGSVAWVLGKVYFASKLGISKTKLAVSSFLEAILQIITVLLTASLLLVLDPRSYQLAGNWIWVILGLAILSLIAVIPAVLSKYLGFIYQLVKQAELDQSAIPKSKTLVQAVGLFAISSLVSGLALYFVALAIAPEIGVRELMFVLAASNLASAVSMAAVFAPAGIGVREAIQIAALLFVMSPEQALAVALLMRLMSILWDGLFLVVTKGIRAAR
jgi:glycosyltransferase 2 family protein